MQFQNKITEIDGTFDSIERKATYADLIKIAFGQIRPDNNLATMRKDFKIVDILDAAIQDKAEEITFTDEQFKRVKEIATTCVWGFKHRGLLSLEDDLNELK